VEHNVLKEEDGLTVKQILQTRLTLSRACINRLKKLDDGIVLNGARVTVRAAVREGDVLSLAVEDREDVRDPFLAPLDLPLDILYEDGGCMAVNKPSGMPTHPTHGHWGDTLANVYAAYMEKQGKPFVFRPVNRLDRATSGAVLLAKNKPAAARLGGALARGEIRKEYVAVLCGEIKEDSGEVEGYVVRTAGSIITRELKSEGRESDYSLTRWKKLASGSGYTVVSAEPVTGRTHQLRVHFASIGRPIAGDDLYGTGEDPCGRLALHARTLVFPADGGTVEVSARIPAEMNKLIEKITEKTDG